jgi:hypothetical protein
MVSTPISETISAKIIIFIIYSQHFIIQFFKMIELKYSSKTINPKFYNKKLNDLHN